MSKPAVTPQASPNPKAKKTLPSISDRLFSCLVDLLFCCGFTLSAKIQVDHHKINYVIWYAPSVICTRLIVPKHPSRREKGVGSTADPGPGQAFENNRTEVLRTLLVLFSKQIYAPPSALFTSPSLYTLHFVQHSPRRDVLTILCSLLNTAMNAPHAVNHNLIGGVTGKLPYNHLMFKGEDTKANLVGMCLEVLCVLLDFQSGSARDIPANDGESSAPTARTNAFRYFIAKLVSISAKKILSSYLFLLQHRASDFEFILHGLVGIFQEQMSSIHPLLPGSKKSVPYIVETGMYPYSSLVKTQCITCMYSHIFLENDRTE